jgi:hypothetical protein
VGAEKVDSGQPELSKDKTLRFSKLGSFTPVAMRKSNFLIRDEISALTLVPSSLSRTKKREREREASLRRCGCRSFVREEEEEEM